MPPKAFARQMTKAIGRHGDDVDLEEVKPSKHRSKHKTGKNEGSSKPKAATKATCTTETVSRGSNVARLSGVMEDMR